MQLNYGIFNAHSFRAQLPVSLAAFLLLVFVIFEPASAGEVQSVAPSGSPDLTAPAQTAPAQTAPAQTMPAQTAPAQTAPAQTTPAQTMPAQTAPAQTAPAQTAPAQTAPAQTMPAQTALENPPLANDGIHYVHMKLSGSSCAACLKELENKLNAMPGVSEAKIDHYVDYSAIAAGLPQNSETITLALSYDSGQIAIEQIRGFLHSRGYWSYKVVDGRGRRKVK